MGRKVQRSAELQEILRGDNLMKLMYLTFQEDAPLYLGVKNKIEGQISAFEKLGYQVTCSMWEGSSFKFLGRIALPKPLTLHKAR